MRAIIVSALRLRRGWILGKPYLIGLGKVCPSYVSTGRRVHAPNVRNNNVAGFDLLAAENFSSFCLCISIAADLRIQQQ